MSISSFQFINLYHLLLASITIVYIEYNQQHYHYEQLRLTAKKIRSQNVATNNVFQRCAAGKHNDCVYRI